MNGAQLLIKALANEGVDTVFGYPGGAIMPVYDALYGAPIRHILARHEQGAAIAAIGYARTTGRVGVCLATSGPGATNLVTGIADAYLDSVPLVAITGQVAQALLGTDAFQEVDIFGITLPIVKHSFLVRDVGELGAVVREAFFLARHGRPGPVLIDLPKDVTLAAAPTSLPPRYDTRKTAAPLPPPGALEHAKRLLVNSARPLLYVGGGVALAGAVGELRAFLQATGVPAVTTLKGIGTVPTSHPTFLGMLGMHGGKAANLAVQRADLLICAGARFDDRATGKLDTFAPHAKVIHLDIDAAEVGKLRAVQAPVIGDMRAALAALSVSLPHIGVWQRECAAAKETLAARYDAPGDDIFAPSFLRELSVAADANTIFTSDVGQHQMWVAQHCHFLRPEQHLTSGGLGTMGFGLPAAIGAQIANPKARVINVTGDGSIMMNVQELATIKRYGLPIKIVLLDNQNLGMVRQWQELFFAERYSETDLSDNPDFLAIAAACGIRGVRLDKRVDTGRIIADIMNEPGPLMVHVPIDRRANVWPLVAPGSSNAEMMEAALAVAGEPGVSR